MRRLAESSSRCLTSGTRSRSERTWGYHQREPQAGHVPEAVNVPIGLLRAEDGTLRSADELRGVFEGAGITKDKALITYCTIGNRASEAWFALKYFLDYPDVRVYYGSWVEWGKATDTPIET